RTMPMHPTGKTAAAPIVALAVPAADERNVRHKRKNTMRKLRYLLDFAIGIAAGSAFTMYRNVHLPFPPLPEEHRQLGLVPQLLRSLCQQLQAVEQNSVLRAT
ncbi:MAG: hypothetical protein ACOCWJ_05350, partial [Verrucomicrobiota bacterium]